jgi:very-short-patch-repair endonuclease
MEKTPNYITQLSRELRQNSTRIEEIMWNFLRKKQL